MRHDKNFEIKTIRLNGHNVKVRVPIKAISLEEALEREKRILSKYSMRYFSIHRK
jgi:hypothetical protein